jgi:ParB family chromosome partitioning protein
VQGEVEAGRIGPSKAYELTKIDDAAEQAEAAREAAAGRLRRDDLAERTRKPREGRGGRPKPWSFSTERVKVVVSARAGDVSEEELTEAIAAALRARRGKGRTRAA